MFATIFVNIYNTARLMGPKVSIACILTVLPGNLFITAIVSVPNDAVDRFTELINVPAMECTVHKFKKTLL